MPRLTYKKAGVDTEKAGALIRKIQGMARTTFRDGTLSDIGGFGGLFRLNIKQLKDPVLVSSTDGVGTKLKVAQLINRHNTIGIDLVAMCVNDVLVSGADPLFFLDYIAVGKLKPEVSLAIIRGIVKGCKIAGCALIGGETAEMPSFYPEGVYDVAGFSVGIVDRKHLINGQRIKAGDILVGLPSSGLHSNGYSLARKIIFDVMGMKIMDRFPDTNRTIGGELLVPTRIYVKTIKQILKQIRVKGIAHITGGGLTENIPRIFPRHLSALIYPGAWPVPVIFNFLSDKGGIASDEMYRVFNMGIGMVMVVAEKEVKQLMRILSRSGEKAYRMGKVIRSKGMSKVIYG